jgi:L-2-hydroxyglutarate oxidase LhgO
VTDYDIVVVGAGVVGLAVAARLAPRGRLLVLERHEGICRETSSRSSEVVHAGLYYPAGSLKATSCVRGRELLVERCAARGIAAPAVGKLVVALHEDELPGLEALARTALANGVPVESLDAATLRRRWPGVPGIQGLWSPNSGIVDSHALAASLEAEARSVGADVVFRSEVVGVEPGWRLAVRSGTDRVEVSARVVVNAAGLGQDRLSALAGLDVDALGLRQHPCKGSWFTIHERHRGRGGPLLYPVGSGGAAGLGVHLCRDVGGGLRLGPDAEWVDGPPFDLRVDPGRRDAFWRAGRRLMPWLEPDDLRPDQAGVRAKLAPPGGGFADFVVREESAAGHPGWVTMAGIESPGLTAALALAEEAERRLADARGWVSGTSD